MVHIYYYVSGHGFGHSTRVAQVVSALLESPGTKLTVITLAPEHLFHHSPRLLLRRQEVDSAIVQPLPYDIDTLGTFRDLERFAAKEAVQNWISQEAKLILDGSVRLILADAPWIVGLLKQYNNLLAKIPVAIISNFTFDLIYKNLVQYLPADSPPESKDKCNALVETVTKAYSEINYLIRLPGAIEFPFLAEPKCRTKVFDVPLVYRPCKATKQTVLDHLSIPEEYQDNKILLVQFGGHAVNTTTRSPTLPEGWIGLMSVPQDDPRFFTFPSSYYLPDLINASHAVLGKIGYGTVSEAVGIGKPLIYVRREMFAEEEYLLKYMKQEGVCLEMDKVVFEAGSWQESIEMIDRRHQAAIKGGEKFGVPDGSREVAKQVYTILGQEYGTKS